MPKNLLIQNTFAEKHKKHISFEKHTTKKSKSCLTFNEKLYEKQSFHSIVVLTDRLTDVRTDTVSYITYRFCCVSSALTEEKLKDIYYKKAFNLLQIQ